MNSPSEHAGPQQVSSWAPLWQEGKQARQNFEGSAFFGGGQGDQNSEFLGPRG